MTASLNLVANAGSEYAQQVLEKHFKPTLNKYYENKTFIFSNFISACSK